MCVCVCVCVCLCVCVIVCVCVCVCVCLYVLPQSCKTVLRPATSADRRSHDCGNHAAFRVCGERAD